jgi:hypothetical protein
MKSRSHRSIRLASAASAMLLPIGGCSQIDLIRLYVANNGTDVQTAASLPQALPFKDAEGYILLPASINGAAPIDFVLDTGADIPTLLAGPRTRHLALSMKGARKLGPAGDLAAPVGSRQDGLDIDFGGVVFKRQTAIAIDEAGLACRGPGSPKAPFAGVIGHDLFRRFTVEVNRDRGLVVLHDPQSFRYRGTGSIVPLEFDGRQIYARATVAPLGGTPFRARLHVDTGSNTALSLAPGTKAEIAAPAAGEIKSACFAGGRADYRVGAPVRLELGGVAATTPVQYALGRELGSSSNNGRIGAPYLARYNVIFDYARKRMILEERQGADGRELKRRIPRLAFSASPRADLSQAPLSGDL